MELLPRIALCLALVGAAGGGLAWLKHARFPDSPVLAGVKVDGERVSFVTVEKVARAHADALLGRTIELRVAGEAAPIGKATLGALGVGVDVQSAIAEARAFGHTGSDLLGRLAEVERARRGEIDVALTPTVATEQVLAYLAPLKAAFDTAPTSARLDLEHRTVVPGRDGRSLDLQGAVAMLRDAASDPTASSLVLKTSRVPPPVSGELLANLDLHAVVSEFETYFSRGGDQTRRGRNIDNAAHKLDGLILMPGETISFNAVVGDRSLDNGFEKSWEIFKGEMVEGVGGGTCQVASTFHAAAFFGGLEVLERLPHSRPSAYIPMGLDATVVYPSVDMKLRNPHDFPVVVHATTSPAKLRVELLGARKPVKVSFGRSVEQTLPFSRKVEEVGWLAGNKVIVKQHGIRGYRIKRTRTMAFAGGVTKQEATNDIYPPTIEIYEVPTGFDVALLPALPEALAEGAAAEAINVTPPAAPCTSDCVGPSQTITFINAPGAHSPTPGQAGPPKTLFLSR